ncbi:MAG: hypothetical protein CMK71_06780 [Pseudomonadaceae bacterium]|nr:hypothetical protein [Pseudomonadaceae bacterium]
MARLPSLHALRVFECAARHESFTKAGEELGLTQSAVSKQVALLEEHFGTPLFVRSHRKIVSTEAGRLVARAVTSSLVNLNAQLEKVSANRPQQIRVVADADFAQLWLFPRLPSFERLYPEFRLSIQSETSLQNPPDGGYDCALLWGRGNWRNCRFESLFTNNVFPVAAPGYFSHLRHAPRMSDLRSQMLIHDRSSFWWTSFLAADGSQDIDPEHGRVYSQTVLCLEAAARGDGVTIGDEATTRGYLEKGLLTAPFSFKLPSPDAYYLVRPSYGDDDEAVELFVEWLKSESEEHKAWFSAYWQ